MLHHVLKPTLLQNWPLRPATMSTLVTLVMTFLRDYILFDRPMTEGQVERYALSRIFNFDVFENTHFGYGMRRRVDHRSNIYRSWAFSHSWHIIIANGNKNMFQVVVYTFHTRPVIDRVTRCLCVNPHLKCSPLTSGSWLVLTYICLVRPSQFSTLERMGFQSQTNDPFSPYASKWRTILGGFSCTLRFSKS